MDDETRRARSRVDYLTNRMEVLRAEEKILPFERDDWRRVKRELARVEEALAQARREVEIFAEWDKIDWNVFGDKPLTSDQIALARRKAFHVIPGGRGVRHQP